MLADAGGPHPGSSPWDFHLHLDVLAVMGALAVAYVVAIRRLGPRLVTAGEPVITPRQRLQFAAGLVLLTIVSVWPIHDLAEGYSYAVHMVQHSVYTLAAPPLLILGTPAWLWRWALRPVAGLVRRLTTPVAALAVFSAVTAFSHLPVAANAAIRSEAAHLGQHVLLVVTAGIVWWPMASRVPDLPRLTRPVQQIVYLFGMSLVPSVVGSALIWAQGTPYRAYEAFPTLGGGTALDDQQTAGLVMGLADGVLLWGLIVVILVRLATRPAATAPSPRLT